MSPFGDINNQFFYGSITQSIFVEMKYFIEVTHPKEAKIIGVCEIFFFIKNEFLAIF